jgi:hypothetical protein
MMAFVDRRPGEDVWNLYRCWIAPPTPFARDLVQPPSGPLAALNEDLRYPPDPPTAGEIIPVMLAAGDAPEGGGCGP